MNKIRN